MSTINVYTTPPQREHKALEECRRARIKASLPMAKINGRSRVVAPRYLAAEARPANSQYVRDKVGAVARPHLAAFYRRARVRNIKLRPVETPLKLGDEVLIKAGPFADTKGKLAKKRGRKEWLVEIGAKSIGTVCVQIHNMVRIDPG